MARLRLIGVPSSAGAHAPGLEKGPAKLRAAGLAGALSAAGVPAWDRGDLPVSPFATTAAESGARNLPAVMEVARRVSDAVAAARADGDIAEVNPDHDPTGELTSQLVTRWSAAVAAGMQHWRG